MEFIIEHYMQLSLGVVLGLALFVIAYMAKTRTVLAVILVTLPFQPISTRYGSLNMVMIYAFFLILLAKGKLREWPLFPVVMCIAFAYLLSITQTQTFVMKDHMFYVISVGGNFALFYTVYNYFRENPDVRFAMRLLLGTLVATLAYYAFSAFVGFEHFQLLGIEELALTGNDEEKRRLHGPFNGAEFGSDFLGIQVLLLGFLLMHQPQRWKQLFLLACMFGSSAFMFASGSRGGPVGMTIAGLFMLFLFRRELGAGGLARVGIVAGLLVLAGVMMVTFSEYNVILERLEATHLVGLELDTRAGIFDLIWPKILDNPLLGHGPQTVMANLDDKIRMGYIPLGFVPHNLYLFLLYTVGIVGFIPWMVFLLALGARWWAWRWQQHPDPLIRAIPRFGVVIMFFFLITEYRIEFLRFILNDYQNYLFALWGILLAFTGIPQQPPQAPSPRATVTDTPATELGVLRRRQPPPLLRQREQDDG